MKVYNKMREPLPVFVFGSNEAGRHGKGAADFARRMRGAISGQGEGHQGNAYGIPTKDKRLVTLPLSAIKNNVERFKAYAVDHPELRFEVTPIGCGLAGYKRDQIKPFFEPLPDNCFYSKEWDDER